MKVSAKATLKASLVGSVVGIGAWLAGIGDSLWKGHPQMAQFILTLAVTVAAMYFFANQETRSNNR